MAPLKQIITMHLLGSVLIADYLQVMDKYTLIIALFFQLVVTCLWGMTVHYDEYILNIIEELLFPIGFYSAVIVGFCIISGRIPYITLVSLMFIVVIPLLVSTILSIKNYIKSVY